MDFVARVKERMMKAMNEAFDQKVLATIGNARFFGTSTSAATSNPPLTQESLEESVNLIRKLDIVGTSDRPHFPYPSCAEFPLRGPPSLDPAFLGQVELCRDVTYFKHVVRLQKKLKKRSNKVVICKTCVDPRYDIYMLQIIYRKGKRKGKHKWIPVWPHDVLPGSLKGAPYVSRDLY